MAAPGYLNVLFRPGDDGTPDNDEDPIIGAMDTGAVFVPTDPNTRLSNVTFPTDEAVDYHGGGYVDLDSSGDLLNARVVLRNGMQLNAAAGVLQLVSTSKDDVNDVIVTGHISGNLVQRTVTLNGTTPVVTADAWDESVEGDVDTEKPGIVRIDNGQIPAGNLTASVLGQTVGAIWKTVTLPTGQTRLGTWLCSSEWLIALATAKDTTIGATDRLTAPTGLSAFARATRWPGSDQGLTVPGGRLDGGEAIGWCERFRALPNNFPTTLGYHTCDVAAAGTPVA